MLENCPLVLQSVFSARNSNLFQNFNSLFQIEILHAIVSPFKLELNAVRMHVMSRKTILLSCTADVVQNALGSDKLWPYTVRRVDGKSRHPDRMSQNQTGCVTEEVTGIDDCEMRPPCWQIPIHRKIPNVYPALYWKIPSVHPVIYRIFLTKLENSYCSPCHISDYSDNIGKFLSFTLMRKWWAG